LVSLLINGGQRDDSQLLRRSWILLLFSR
jgi:hypothetical protein